MREHTIERLGHYGDGIADGPLFAPLTLPGERVIGTVEGSALKDIKIVTPSDARVSPPCPHFRACGGCSLQHASDGFVSDWKEGIVRSALSAHGIETQFKPIHTSPDRSRRRASFAARRTKKGAMAGFHSRASDAIIEVPNCVLLEPDLMIGLDVARDLAAQGASRKTTLSVTVTLFDNGLDVAVAQGKPLDGALQISLSATARKWGLARLSWDDELVAMEHPPRLSFGQAAVSPPPGSFLQATSDGEQALLKAVSEALEGASEVVDLFSGSGTFALPLAETARVHAVEGDADMTAALDQGWRNTSGLKPITTEVRDLFRRPLLPDELARFEAVVIDPPRAGAENQVKQIAQVKIPRLAYVSCNPTTFARDAQVLVAAGYRLDWVKVVDQFRWSTHVELASRFTLEQ